MTNNTNNTTNEIDATIDAIFNEHNDTLTIVDVANTTFAMTNDDDANEIIVCDMFISCM